MARATLSTTAAAAWLNQAKLRPPAIMVPLIDRPRLMRRLMAGADRRLTLLSAPPGYGKTALMSQWAAQLQLRGLATPWLTLDPADGDPDRFAAYLAGALTVAGLPPAPSLTDPGFVRSDPLGSIADRLVAIVQAIDRPTAILVDNSADLPGGPLPDLLGVMLRSLPAGVHLGLACRQRPGFGVAALATRGLVTELGGDELRFTAGETGDLFGRALAPAAAEALTAMVEGWPAALEIVRMRWRAGDLDLDGTIPAELWPALAAYFEEVVWDRLAPAEQGLLLETAILERLSIEAADAVRERDDSAQILPGLLRLAPVLSLAPDDSGAVVRHRLLGAFLERKLSLLPAQRRRRLHARAARWLADAGAIREAVGHARQSGDIHLAAELIERAGGVQLFLSHGMVTLRTLVDDLPPAVIRSSQELMLSQALMLAKTGRLDEARQAVEDLKAVADAGQPSLATDILHVDYLVAFYQDRGQTVDDLERHRRLLARSAGTDHGLRGWLNNYLCLANFGMGALNLAELHVADALAQYQEARSTYGVFFMRVHRGILQLACGRAREALADFAAADALAAQHHPDDQALRAVGWAASAEAHYLLDQLDAAAAALDQAVGLIARGEGWVDLYARAFTIGAATAFATAGAGPALAQLDRADDLATGRGLWRLAWLVRAARLTILVRDGQLDRAAALGRDIAADLDARPATGPARVTWRERVAGALALGWLDLARGAPERTLSGLSSAIRECRRIGAGAALVEALILQALALHATERVDEAVATLREVLGLSVPAGQRRLYVDAGERMSQLLRVAIRHDGVGAFSSATIAFIGDVLSALEGKPGAKAAKTNHNSILSLREHQILVQLSLGLSNKRIGRSLALSEPTVKFHLRNIFAKLGVHNRVMALSVARRRGLL